MTDMFSDNDQIQGNNNNGLRTWAESVNSQNKELQKQLADVQAQLKSQSVSSMLSELGVPATAAKLYSGDADPEAVKAWVTDIKSAFGNVGNQNTDDGTPAPPAAPILTQEQQLQYQQLSAAGSEGRQSTGLEDAQRGVNQAANVQDLIANFRTHIR